MLDDDIVPASDSGENPDNPPAPKKAPAPVPYERFQQVVQQRRELDTKLAEVNAALGNAETAKLAAEQKLSEQQAEVTRVTQEADAKVAHNTALLDKYKEVISSTVNDMTTDWPEEAKMFDPGADADPLVRLEWAQKAKLLVAKLQPGIPGAGAAPKPTPKQPTPATQDVKSLDVKRRF